MHDLYGGVYDGRLGSLGVMNNKEVVLEVKFLGNDDKHKDIFYTLKHNVLTKKVFDSLDNYFLGKQRYFDLPLMPKGGDFAQKVSFVFIYGSELLPHDGLRGAENVG